MNIWNNDGNNQKTNKPRIKKKKCFICNKKGWWSNKHTREKQENSKNKFKKQFF